MFFLDDNRKITITSRQQCTLEYSRARLRIILNIYTKSYSTISANGLLTSCNASYGLPNVSTALH